MAEPSKRKINENWAEAACNLFEKNTTAASEMELQTEKLTRGLPDADLEKLLDAMMRGACRSAY